MTTTTLFNFSSTPTSGSRAPKLHVINGSLPSFIDPSQPPLKKSPWHQIHQTPFICSVTLTVPQSLGTIFQERALGNGALESRYAKVIMKLSEVLEGEFFDEYIKKGDILMLSKPNTTSNDPSMTIQSGKLTIDMPSHIYQRSGLPNGASIPSGGRKHTNSRFRVQYDLRSTAMLRGKKGFDRLLRASREVEGLNQSMNWCFVDLSSCRKPDQQSTEAASITKQTIPTDGPISKHHPTMVEVEASSEQLNNVQVPDIVARPLLQSQSATDLMIEDDLYELVEWLDLLKLASPRILAGDKSDPFICNYSMPGNEEDIENMDLVNFTWKGLLSADWLVRMVIEVIRLSRSADSTAWACVSVNPHRTEAVGQIDGCSILLSPDTTRSHEGRTPDDDVMQTDRKEAKHAKGLQHFTCFQFVDSLVS